MRRLGSVLLLVAAFAAGALCPALAAEKDWTFMVFINADNNLDGLGVEDQEEMARVGGGEHLNVVTLIDRQNGPATLNVIEKGEVRPLRELGEVDMGDWRQLVAFFEEAAKLYPARHYALVVWNHGSGWRRVPSGPRGISYDDTNGTNIGTRELGQAVRAMAAGLGRKLDLLCMDACLMQMMEVAWEVREGCDFVVASEEVEPGDGYPYETILKRLVPGIEPREFAAGVVNAYQIYFQNVPDDDDPDRPARTRKTTQSAVECAKLPAVKEALDGFAAASLAAGSVAAVGQACGEVQRFHYDANMDLIHFLRRVQVAGASSALAAAARAAEAAAVAAVVANGSTGSNDDDGGWGGDDPDWPGRWGLDAYGLAIYFPPESAGFAPEYLDLTFAGESSWDEMVQDYYHRSAVLPVLAALRAGDLAPLSRFAAAAAPANRALCRRLLREANASLSAAAPRPRFDWARYGRLVEEMLSRTRARPGTGR